MNSEIIRLWKNYKIEHCVIIALFRGKNPPDYCEPMPREPNLHNIPVLSDFSNIYYSALRENPSIKDGVVLIRSDCNPPVIWGFSYRIYPPPLSIIYPKINMGSGYYSSLSFSGVERVHCVYFLYADGVIMFKRGLEEQLCSRFPNTR